MSALRIEVRARDVRVGDEVEVQSGSRGVVAAIRDHRQYVSLDLGGMLTLLHRDDPVTVTLEDDGR
jgi:hypothetical protein